MLDKTLETSAYDTECYLPAVNIRENLLCHFLAFVRLNPLLYPCYEVILECPFDNLVENISQYQFMNVSAGEIFSKWLDSYTE